MVKYNVMVHLNNAHVPRNISAKQAFKYNSNNSPQVSIQINLKCMCSWTQLFSSKITSSLSTLRCVHHLTTPIARTLRGAQQQWSPVVIQHLWLTLSGSQGSYTFSHWWEAPSSYVCTSPPLAIKALLMTQQLLIELYTCIDNIVVYIFNSIEKV